MHFRAKKHFKPQPLSHSKTPFNCLKPSNVFPNHYIFYFFFNLFFNNILSVNLYEI